MIFQNLNIESTWGYGGYLFSFGGFNLPNGTIFVPLFIGIVMPNVKPAWLTLIIFSVQSLWGNQHSTYIFSEDLKTLPYALQQVTQAGVARAGVGAAVALVMIIVPVGIFIFSESNILETMASSGIKE